MLPKSLYLYVWQTSRAEQIRVCLLIAVIAPLAMVPLELQRRIVDNALTSHDVRLLATLGTIYLGVALLQGGLKYFLNMVKGRILENVTRDLRKRLVHRVQHSSRPDVHLPLPHIDEGTTISIIAAEAEDVGTFASESLAVPVLQIGTMTWVMAYLVWVEPSIAILAAVIFAPQVILVPRIQSSINHLSRSRTSLVRRLGRNIVAKADAKEAKEQKLPNIMIGQLFRLRILIYRRKFFLKFLGDFLEALGPIVVLIAGGYLVILEKTDVSTLVVFVSGFQKLADPWDQLINFYRSVSNTRVTYGLVAEVLGDLEISLA